MDPTFVLAELRAQGSLHALAYSARPDAPVLPIPARRRFARLGRLARLGEPRPSQPPSTARTPRRRARPVVDCA